MSETPLILGVSGLRGIVGESLTPEVAVRYAGAFGGWLQTKIPDRRPLVLVARDGRRGGESTYAAAVSALLASGCDVRRLGVAMTPTVGVSCDLAHADGGVIITASHNPQEWDGIKLLVRPLQWGMSAEPDAPVESGRCCTDARAPDAAAAGEVIELFRGGLVKWWGGENIRDSTAQIDAADQHRLRVLGACERAIGVEEGGFWEWLADRRAPNVVIDSVNAGGVVASRIMFESTPCHAVQLHGQDSGVFPHPPEPTRENLSGAGGLCDAVPGLKADIGFAQDPDADRLAIVDENGAYIGEEFTIVLCAVALMEARKDGRLEVGPTGVGPTGDGKPVFVVNLSTSRMIDDVAAHYGAEVMRTAVGEANVVERMKQLTAAGRDVVMGGEGNGGLIWPEVTYVRDSLSAMALTLALMARTGKKVSELVRMVEAMGPLGDAGRGYRILKRKTPLASKADAAPVVARLAEFYGREPDARVDTQDGVRIDWPARGVWAHVRASNTEPILRLIVEAPTEGETAAVAAALEEHTTVADA